jgi:hypothetical protein
MPPNALTPRRRLKNIGLGVARRGEACATSFEIVWTYPTETLGGADS